MKLNVEITNLAEFITATEVVLKKPKNYKKQFNDLMQLSLKFQRHMIKKFRKDGVSILDTKKATDGNQSLTEINLTRLYHI